MKKIFSIRKHVRGGSKRDKFSIADAYNCNDYKRIRENFVKVNWIKFLCGKSSPLNCGKLSPLNCILSYC